MTGSCWRLLAVFSLTVAAPPLVLGQDAAGDPSPAFSFVRAPDLPPLTYPVPIAAPRIPLAPNPPPRYPGTSGTGVLQQLVLQNLIRAAGIIFSGRVTFIGRAASSSRPNPASTAVTFQVENAVRGALPGQSLTIHEWAGLWTNGERYRVGERVLLFLYAPGKLGLTSPVAGTIGRFTMNSQGKIVMGTQQVAILAADPILGGRAVVPYADFALAMRRSSLGN